MRRQIKHIVFTALVVLLFITAQNAHALQVISPVEGESVFVNISKSELNMVQFPFSGLRAYTSSQKLDIKVQGKQVLISVTDPSDGKPQEVFFSTSYGTYLLMLVPKNIPAETIMMRINKERIEEAEEWEKGHDYETRLKELVKALYVGNPPAGYSVNTDKEDVSSWEGVEQTVVMTMTGAGLVGEVQNIVNHSTDTVKITEGEFYREGILAVSLTSNELRSGAKEQVFIVRRNKADANRKTVTGSVSRPYVNTEEADNHD